VAGIALVLGSSDATCAGYVADDLLYGAVFEISPARHAYALTILAPRVFDAVDTGISIGAGAFFAGSCTWSSPGVAVLASPVLVTDTRTTN